MKKPPSPFFVCLLALASTASAAAPTVRFEPAKPGSSIVVPTLVVPLIVTAAKIPESAAALASVAVAPVAALSLGAAAPIAQPAASPAAGVAEALEKLPTPSQDPSGVDGKVGLDRVFEAPAPQKIIVLPSASPDPVSDKPSPWKNLSQDSLALLRYLVDRGPRQGVHAMLDLKMDASRLSKAVFQLRYGQSRALIVNEGQLGPDTIALQSLTLKPSSLPLARFFLNNDAQNVSRHAFAVLGALQAQGVVRGFETRRSAGLDQAQFASALAELSGLGMITVAGDESDTAQMTILPSRHELVRALLTYRAF